MPRENSNRIIDFSSFMPLDEREKMQQPAESLQQLRNPQRTTDNAAQRNPDTAKNQQRRVNSASNGTTTSNSSNRIFHEASYKSGVVAFEYVLVKCSDVRPHLDIICERGGKGNRAPGNLLYRAFGRCLIDEYLTNPSSSERSLVQRAFLEFLQASEFRFLEACYRKDEGFSPLPRDKATRNKMKNMRGKIEKCKTHYLQNVSESFILEKIRQFFRDNAAKGKKDGEGEGKVDHLPSIIKAYKIVLEKGSFFSDASKTIWTRALRGILRAREQKRDRMVGTAERLLEKGNKTIGPEHVVDSQFSGGSVSGSVSGSGNSNKRPRHLDVPLNLLATISSLSLPQHDLQIQLANIATERRDGDGTGNDDDDIGEEGEGEREREKEREEEEDEEEVYIRVGRVMNNDSLSSIATN